MFTIWRALSPVDVAGFEGDKEAVKLKGLINPQ